MNIIRRMWRRLFPPPKPCPYLKCRAPMEFVEQVNDQGTLVDVYRCTGPEEHEWVELADEQRGGGE